jgi:D-serine deaminase-like pyridoxal phosphate-dependent protein
MAIRSMSAPRFVDELETPAVVIDLDVVERNVRRAQEHFDALGVVLRPHVKTHKLPELARLQLSAGATGIACQTLAEAEVMIDEAGALDVLLPLALVGEAKAQRLGRLLAARPEAEITVGVDSLAAAGTVDVAARAARRRAGVLIELDVGGRRAGVESPDEAVALAEGIADALDHVEVRGVLAYPTPVAAGPRLTEAQAALEAAGVSVDVVSGGGTPTMWDASATEAVTEYRIGTYVFFDRNSIGAGAATEADCALRVVTTVASRPTPARAILDAGSKSLSSDQWATAPEVEQAATYGLASLPGAVLYALNEEHGYLDVSACDRAPGVGDRLTLIPNHCCVACNLQDVVYAVRGGRVEAALPVARSRAESLSTG